MNALRAFGLQGQFGELSSLDGIDALLKQRWHLVILDEGAEGPAMLKSTKAKLKAAKRSVPIVSLHTGMQGGDVRRVRRGNWNRLALVAAWELKDSAERRIRKRLLRERVEAEDELTRLFNRSGELILIADFEGLPKRVNPAFEKIFGGLDNASGPVSLLEVVHPSDHAKAVAYLEKMRRGEPDPNFEVRLRDRFGKYRDTVWSGTPESSSEVIFVVGRDVTDHKRRSEQERQAAKMEALGQLAAGIAHDFNNLLTAILGFSGIVQQDMRAGSMQAEMLGQVIDAGKRAAELVQRINAFGRTAKPSKRPIRLEPVVDEVTKLLRASLPSTLEIERSFDRDLRPVDADPAQIHQVILNLATNAAHAISEKSGVGKIRLGLSEVSIDVPKKSDLGDIPMGRYVRLDLR